MFSHRLGKILSAIFLFLCAVPGPAQMSASLSRLKDDPAVQRFTLSNGVNCYFAVSRQPKGLFDVALVQKVDGNLSRKERIDAGRDRFSRARITDVAIEDFLARNGIKPDVNGFVFTSRGVIGYKFSDVSSGCGPAVRDSLLYALMSIVRLSVENGMPTGTQAICLSGDFDATQVRTALTTLAMIVPSTEGRVARPVYVWDPAKLTRGGIYDAGGDTPGIVVKWFGARVPDELMQTVFSVVYDKMSSELGLVLQNRLYTIFRSSGLHVWIDWKHTGSAATFGDERYELRVFCPLAIRSAVRDVLTEELQRLATWGVSVEEYCFARDICRNRWMTAAVSQSNLQTLQKCVCNFIYGSSLATENDKIGFSYRNVADSISTRLFNRYMQQRISSTNAPDSSLAQFPAPVSRDSIASRIRSYGWNVPIKMPKDMPDKASGGTMWHFASGVDVICCRTQTHGMVHYCYALKGTRKYADRDFLTCIDGVPEERFSRYLASRGIVMDVELGQNDVRLSGKVPAENLDELMLVLCALSSQSENAQLCGPLAYKLLVLSTDCPVDGIKKILSQRITGLRPGGVWRYEEPVPVEVVEDSYDRPLSWKVGSEWFAVLDKSAYSNALVSLAREAVAVTLARELGGKAACFTSDAEFADVDGEGCKISMFASQSPLDGFSVGDRTLSDEELLQALNSSIDRLARQTLSPEKFAVCRQRALNAFETLRGSPQYPIILALDRHLDNRDLLSRFQAEMAGITPSELRDLFASMREL